MVYVERVGVAEAHESRTDSTRRRVA